MYFEDFGAGKQTSRNEKHLREHLEVEHSWRYIKKT